jgi:putative nucleotidyltransferase with HDIG domain
MGNIHAHDLVAEVTRLPVQPGAAMRLLWMLEDPRTSATSLGQLIESDPALSTQVIRLANSALYGLSGKVASAWRAVTVLGLPTVRAIATTAAFDLFSAEGRAVPDAFWPHSVTTAAAAAAIARRLGIEASEAFSAGLLHDVGAALLFRRAPRRYDLVYERVERTGCTIVEAERAEFGATHADVGGAALGMMKFPSAFVEAVGSHSEAPATAGVLARVVAAADAIAQAAAPADQGPGAAPPDEAVRALGLPARATEAIVAEVREDRESLSGFLSLNR